MLCLDTDIVIEYLKGNRIVVNKIEYTKEQLYITPITLLELYYGAYRSTQVEKHLKEVRELLELFSVLEMDSRVYEEFGKIKAQLQEEGKVIDNFDLLIGVTCRIHNARLVTNNTKHFSKIKNLNITNWLETSS